MPTSRSWSRTGDKCHKWRHPIAVHASSVDDDPPTPVQRQQRKMNSSNRSTNITTVVFGGETSLPNAAPKCGTTLEVRERERKLGCQKGEGCPSLYRLREEATLLG